MNSEIFGVSNRFTVAVTKEMQKEGISLVELMQLLECSEDDIRVLLLDTTYTQERLDSLLSVLPGLESYFDHREAPNSRIQNNWAKCADRFNRWREAESVDREAQALYLGCDVSRIESLEAGKTSPTVSEFRRLRQLPYFSDVRLSIGLVRLHEYLQDLLKIRRWNPSKLASGAQIPVEHVNRILRGEEPSSYELRQLRRLHSGLPSWAEEKIVVSNVPDSFAPSFQEPSEPEPSPESGSESGSDVEAEAESEMEPESEFGSESESDSILSYPADKVEPGWVLKRQKLYSLYINANTVERARYAIAVVALVRVADKECTRSDMFKPFKKLRPLFAGILLKETKSKDWQRVFLGQLQTRGFINLDDSGRDYRYFASREQSEKIYKILDNVVSDGPESGIQLKRLIWPSKFPPEDINEPLTDVELDDESELDDEGEADDVQENEGSNNLSLEAISAVASRLSEVAGHLSSIYQSVDGLAREGRQVQADSIDQMRRMESSFMTRLATIEKSFADRLGETVKTFETMVNRCDGILREIARREKLQLESLASKLVESEARRVALMGQIDTESKHNQNLRDELTEIIAKLGE